MTNLLVSLSLSLYIYIYFYLHSYKVDIKNIKNYYSLFRQVTRQVVRLIQIENSNLIQIHILFE